MFNFCAQKGEEKVSWVRWFSKFDVAVFDSERGKQNTTRTRTVHWKIRLLACVKVAGGSRILVGYDPDLKIKSRPWSGCGKGGKDPTPPKLPYLLAFFGRTCNSWCRSSTGLNSWFRELYYKAWGVAILDSKGCLSQDTQSWYWQLQPTSTPRNGTYTLNWRWCCVWICTVTLLTHNVETFNASVRFNDNAQRCFGIKADRANSTHMKIRWYVFNVFKADTEENACSDCGVSLHLWEPECCQQCSHVDRWYW